MKPGYRSAVLPLRASLILLLAAAVPGAALAQATPPLQSTAVPPAPNPVLDEPVETPIPVPSVIPTGLVIAFKPQILSVRIDSGKGSEFGSDKLQLGRGLIGYTSRLLDDKQYLAHVELEGGQFQSDAQGQNIGTDGFDLVLHLLGGAATRVSQGVTIVASAGVLTRFQRGRAVGGAPEIGLFGAASNMELNMRLAPTITLSFFVEGGLTPIPYLTQSKLGVLSDASELRLRAKLTFHLYQDIGLDVGYDFTRWHASFAGTTILGNPKPDQALLIESRQHAILVGLRFQ